MDAVHACAGRRGMEVSVRRVRDGRHGSGGKRRSTRGQTQSQNQNRNQARVQKASITVAAERVLEQLGQQRVAVRDVPLLPLVLQRDDHALEVVQRQVDVLGLLQLLPLRPGPGDPDAWKCHVRKTSELVTASDCDPISMDTGQD